ncbi:MAG: tetratricopeptide repeat protein [Acidobacteriota bacterium]
MTTLTSLRDLEIEPGRPVILEAPPGPIRDERLERWLEETDPGGERSWLLDCDAARHGLWAGLGQWLLDLHPALEERAPELVERHSHEFVNIAPRLRRSIRSGMVTLTDEAQADEAVRNYAIDRGYRLGHGVIELLERWQGMTGDDGWTVVCRDYDRAGALVQRFFRELVRRRGRTLGLRLVLVTSPASGDAEAEDLGFDPAPERIRWTLPDEPWPPVDGAEMRRRAEALEREVSQDPLKIEIHLGELIHLWRSSDRPEGALRWKALALGIYNHYGFYEDALQFVEPILESLESIEPIEGYQYFFTRWNIVGSVFGCLVANGYPERALEVIREEGLDKVTDELDRVRLNYVMAMLHSRFLDQKNLDLAEEYIGKGLDILRTVDAVSDRDQVFLTVFLNNGLAFIRHRQRRPREAIALCRDGFERMDRHLDPDRHRLHRSVLLYNQAQVYSALGEHEEAIEKFDQALEMDPNYSEYYNERGSVYLSMGRYEEAVRDYQRAIETSPPYPEVWTNLGQCLRKMGRVEDAIQAYSRALDLDPEHFLARVGRAQALDLLERVEDAEADYTHALRLDSSDPHLWANRAVLRYQRQDFEASLEDLDRAIELAPEDGDLYHNRAVALESLGDEDRALRDLRRYLELRPDAPDRAAVEERIVAAASGGAA